MAKGDDKLVEKFRDWFDADTQTRNQDWRTRGWESVKFYAGQQWDAEVVQELAKDNRPALTINKVMPTVHVPCGYQRRNRSEVRLFARKGGTEPIARLGTELIKHAIDSSSGHFEISDVFRDGLVTGMGFLAVDVVFEDDPVNGDVIVSRVSPFDVVGDELNFETDLDKGNHLFRMRWVERDWAKAMYPKVTKAKWLDMDNAESWDEAAVPDDRDEDTYAALESLGIGRGSKLEEARDKRQYRFVDIWWKTPHNVVLAIGVGEDGAPLVIRTKDDKEAAKLEGEGARLVPRVIQVLNKAVLSGDMILEQTVDPFKGINRFPVMRYSPFAVEGLPLGIVDNIKDPQRELNKRRSQALHHLNMVAHSGWDANNLGPTALKNLEDFGTKPGAIIDTTGGTLKPITPQPLSTGHITMSELAARDMEEISGVNPDLTGTNPSSNESGRARLIRQEAGLMVTQIAFDNFNRTLEKMGSFAWDLIRRSEIYSDEEIQAILQEDTLQHFTDEQGNNADFSAMRDWRNSNYGVRVERSPHSPTAKSETSEEMLRMREAGIGIPDDLVVEASELPNKEKVIQRIREVQQAALQAAQAQGAKQ
jgi:hypothetical protein